MSSQEKDSEVEIMEDEGFCSMELSNHEENQSFSGWSQLPLVRRGYAGVIKKISLENFMCHSNLSVELNNNINFIIGKNGAGKSAILTAICVALGANAASTNRGQSLKNFIKAGCQTARVTVVLDNSGGRAYKPAKYGETITFVRTITDKASQLKLFSHAGAVIPVKKELLNAMLQCLNIQIDNPVAVLNQIKARTFLASTDEKKLYEVFATSTQVDEMFFLFREILTNRCSILHEVTKLEERKGSLMGEIRKLQDHCDILEKAEGLKVKKESLENELLWARVHQCQAEIVKREETLENHRLLSVEFQNQLENVAAKDCEIREKIAELEAILKESRNKSKQLKGFCEEAKENHRSLKAAYNAKLHDLQFMNKRLRDKESDLAAVYTEIRVLESKETESSAKRQAIQTKRAALREKLQAIETDIRNTDQHRSNVKNSELEVQNRLLRCAESISFLNKEHLTLNSQLANLTPETSLNIFGPFMEELTNHIAQAVANGLFVKQPIGPLGRYIRVRDKAWAPAVESFIGPNVLKSFLVDNSNDTQLLKTIMSRVCGNNKRPAIYCNSFETEVYSAVYQFEAKYRGCKNLLRSLEISDVNVTNLLIDTKKIESVLLIENNELITQLFENESSVPKNCSKCINKFGDTFFPAPNFRCYSGLDPRQTHRNRLLQVSVTDVRNSIEQSIREVRQRLAVSLRDRQRLQGVLGKSTARLGSLALLCKTKRQELLAVRSELSGLVDEEDSVCEEYRLPILRDTASDVRAELSEIESKVKTQKEEVDRLERDVCDAKTRLDQLLSPVHDEEEVDILRTLDEKKDKLKELSAVRKDVLKQQLEATRAVFDLEQDVAFLKAEAESQKIAALAVCEEVHTRDIDSINSELKDAYKYIECMETRMGAPCEEIALDLARKRYEYKHLILSLNRLRKLIVNYSSLIETRKKMFERFLEVTTADMKINFQCALQLRHFEGKLEVNHDTKRIRIRVVASKNSLLTDLKALSGGEKSYVTVSFIMALWRSTDMPFYSMDEFDIFMDQVNLAFATDLLLNIARLKSDSQFIFLTPRELAATVRPSDTLSLFRLEAPKRNSKERE